MGTEPPPPPPPGWTPPQAPTPRRTNWWAIASVPVGLVAAFGAIFIRAAVETNDPDRSAESLPLYPLETLVLAGITLWLGLMGRSKVSDTGRGRGLAWTGVVLAAIGIVMGVGQLGMGLEG